MSKSIYPSVLDSMSSDDGAIRRHGRHNHLHFDIRASIETAHRLLEPFVAGQNGGMIWTDFVKPTRDELWRAFGAFSGLSTESIDRLCDPDRCGAPLSHLSAKKQFLPIGSGDMQTLWCQFRDGVAAMRQAGLHGYVELEELSCRHVLTPPATAPAQTSKMPTLTFGPIDRVPLSHPSVGRSFRTTEVHCTFEHVGKADLRVLDALLESGFYTAYLRHGDGSLKLILTIQGFEPDIGLLYGLLYGWLAQCQATGWITGVVTLKKEDIAAYAILGEPKDCGLQMVVKPLSVVPALAATK